MINKFTPIQVLPSVQNVSMRRGDMEVCMVEISGEEYQRCEEFSHIMWTNKKKGIWGKGMANTTKDPHRVERIGSLGEISLAKLVNSQVDFSYKEGGNETDLILRAKFKAEIKTATHNYGQGLIRAEDERGKSVTLLSDIYVFGYLDEEDINNKHARVGIVGFEIKKNIIKLDMVPAIRGKHLNYAIPYHKLQPILKLITWCEKENIP